MTWTVSSYVASDGTLSWTEYVIDDDQGNPVCTRIQTKAIAQEIVDAHERRSPEASTDRLGLVLEDLLTEVRHLRSDLRERAMGGEGVSSLTIEDMSKGDPKITSKTYGLPLNIDEIDGAIEAHAYAHREAARRSLDGWAETLDGLAERVREGVGE